MSIWLISSINILTGVLVLFFGGELFVQGSVALALILGIPQLVIGLTVVSVGTSSPELFVSVSSVIRGSETLAASNVVGSNIFNLLVVLGSSAIILPLKVESRLIRRDVPLLLTISAAVWGMASSGRITWQSGLALLIALVINTLWEIRTIREEPSELTDSESKIEKGNYSKNLLKAGLKLIFGISLLTLGSDLLVQGATTAARLLDVSEAVIGLTIVSVGTSMPELVTSLVAALKGKTDLAIGNVVGSNLLNQLLVLSTTSVFAGNNGLKIDSILINRDFPVMILATLALIPIFWSNGRISRVEGMILLSLYFLYLTDQILPKTLPYIQDEFRFVVFAFILPIAIAIITIQTIRYSLKLRKDG